ncbi:hypothetical protein HDE_10859 [Halotydeus destructor]|nr:hypothetical protein HDE_10859 [Halotydeus destructor]
MCDTSFKNVDSSCVDELYCRFASDCIGGEIFSVCSNSVCQYRFWFSRESWIYFITFSLALAFIAIAVTCVLGIVCEVEQVVPEHISLSHIYASLPATAPPEDADVYGSPMSAVNITPYRNQESPPPPYFSVMNFEEDFPEPTY